MASPDENIVNLILARGATTAQGLRDQEAIRQDQRDRRRENIGLTLRSLADMVTRIPQIQAQREANQALVEQRQSLAEERQQKIAAGQRAQIMEQAVNQTVQEAMEKQQDGSWTINEQRLRGGLLHVGAPLDYQEKVLKSVRGINDDMSKFATERSDKAARLLNAVIEHGKSPEEMRSAATLAISYGKKNKIISDDEVAPIYQMLASDQDPTPVLRQLRDSLSDKYRGKVEKIGEHESLINTDTGEVTYQGTPSEKATTEASLAVAAAKGDPEAQAALKQLQAPAMTGRDLELQRMGETMRHNRVMEQKPTGGASASAGGEALSQDALEQAAASYRLLGTRGLPTRLSRDDRAKIMNVAAKQSGALGQTPVDTITKQLTTAGDAQSLKKIQTMADSASAFETKALAQADLIGQLSGKVSRTKFPIINGMLQSGRTSIAGDEDATKFANAVETFSEEYAKIMNGTTGGAAAATDSARAASKRLISTAMSQGTLSGILDQMRWEMAQTLKGYDAAKQHITDRIGGTAPATGGTGPRIERWEPDGKGGYRKVGG